MTYRTLIVIEVEHDKPIPHLANMVAGRAWSIDGVRNASLADINGGELEMRQSGFTASELALGRTEVCRG